MVSRHLYGSIILLWILIYSCQSAHWTSKDICSKGIPVDSSSFDHQHGLFGQWQQHHLTYQLMAFEIQQEVSNSVHHEPKQFNGSCSSGQENHHPWHELYYLGILKASLWNNVASKNIIATRAMLHLADGWPPPDSVVASQWQPQQLRPLTPDSTDALGQQQHPLPEAKIFCA